MLIGQGGFVDPEEIGGEHDLQLPQPLPEGIAASCPIDGDHLPFQDGDALDLGEGKPAQLVLPVAQDAVRALEAAHQILDLLGQGGGGMNHRGDGFLCVFVDDEPVFHSLSPYCFFICPRKHHTAAAVAKAA